MQQVDSQDLTVVELALSVLRLWVTPLVGLDADDARLHAKIPSRCPSSSKDISGSRPLDLFLVEDGAFDDRRHHQRWPDRNRCPCR